MTPPDEERNWRISERTITVLGLVLSVVGAVLVPLVATNKSREMEVIIGLATLIAGYLVTLDAAQRVGLRAAKKELSDQITAGEARLYGALPLQRLLSVPEIQESIAELVDAAATARTKRMPFLVNQTIAGIIRESQAIVENSRGKFRCANHQQELQLLREALHDTERELFAVASLGLAEWRTTRFRDYFDVFIEFASEIRQKRIFLVTADEFAQPEMMAILERHQAAGVDTIAVDLATIEPYPRDPMVLFDDGLLLLHVSRSQPEYDVTFTDDEQQLRAAREKFAALWRRAHRPDDPVRLWP